MNDQGQGTRTGNARRRLDAILDERLVAALEAAETLVAAQHHAPTTVRRALDGLRERLVIAATAADMQGVDETCREVCACRAVVDHLLSKGEATPDEAEDVRRRIAGLCEAGPAAEPDAETGPLTASTDDAPEETLDQPVEPGGADIVFSAPDDHGTPAAEPPEEVTYPPADVPGATLAALDLPAEELRPEQVESMLANMERGQSDFVIVERRAPEEWKAKVAAAKEPPPLVGETAPTVPQHEEPSVPEPEPLAAIDQVETQAAHPEDGAGDTPAPAMEDIAPEDGVAVVTSAARPPIDAGDAVVALTADEYDSVHEDEDPDLAEFFLAVVRDDLETLFASMPSIEQDHGAFAYNEVLEHFVTSANYMDIAWVLDLLLTHRGLIQRMQSADVSDRRAEAVEAVSGIARLSLLLRPREQALAGVPLADIVAESMPAVEETSLSAPASARETLSALADLRLRIVEATEGAKAALLPEHAGILERLSDLAEEIRRTMDQTEDTPST